MLTLAASAAEESAESSWWARWAAGDKVSGRMKRDLLRAEGESNGEIQTFFFIIPAHKKHTLNFMF